VEYKTEIIQHDLKMQLSFPATQIYEMNL